MASTKHVLATGFHGTHVNHVDSILSQGLLYSTNEWDWLGDGVYFFQDSPLRAREWAEQHHGTSNAAVLQATIRLENCVDLLDIAWWPTLSSSHRQFVEREKVLPKQTATSGAHRLDRAVLNYMVTVLAESGQTVRCLRAAFVEGERLFPASALYSRSHVQIAVRDPLLIEGLTVLG